jgi:hypothetical protein
MVEFFEVDKTNDTVLNVSPAWLVYWKVTIPMTVALILSLFGWFNLQSVSRRLPPPGQYSVDDEEKRLSSLGSSDYDDGGKSYLVERSPGYLAASISISQQRTRETGLSSASTPSYKGFLAKVRAGAFFNVTGFQQNPARPGRARP